MSLDNRRERGDRERNDNGFLKYFFYKQKSKQANRYNKAPIMLKINEKNPHFSSITQPYYKMYMLFSKFIVFFSFFFFIAILYNKIKFRSVFEYICEMYFLPTLIAKRIFKIKQLLVIPYTYDMSNSICILCVHGGILIIMQLHISLYVYLHCLTKS